MGKKFRCIMNHERNKKRTVMYTNQMEVCLWIQHKCVRQISRIDILMWGLSDSVRISTAVTCSSNSSKTTTF